MPGYLMAFDRPDDDFEAGEARLEQHLRNGGSGSDVPAARSEPAEPRTHEEYYEALRAADGGSSDAARVTAGRLTTGPETTGLADDGSSADGSPGEEPHVADSRTDHSGWDSIDAANRPSLDALRVSPERTTHILDGDADGSGGHRHGIGNPGKTEFPASWDDEKIIDNVLDVARQPDPPPRSPGLERPLGLHCGTRDDVEVCSDRSRSGEVWTGWPTRAAPAWYATPRKGAMTESRDHERAEASRYGSLTASREHALEIIKRMRGGGEYGELTIELAASLAAHKTPVTPEERDELRALLEAMNMPTDPIGQLNVQG